jgi:hypothetical protein
MYVQLPFEQQLIQKIFKYYMEKVFICTYDFEVYHPRCVYN